VELRYFGQQIFHRRPGQPPTTDPAIVAARTRATTTARQLIDDTLARYRLDAIVAPTNGPAVGVDARQGRRVHRTVVLDAAGRVRLPERHGARGLRRRAADRDVVHRHPWSEPEVLSLAYAFEQVTHERRPPQYLPTTGS
jgi:amidase